MLVKKFEQKNTSQVEMSRRWKKQLEEWSSTAHRPGNVNNHKASFFTSKSNKCRKKVVLFI
jgi:hypothetical protein